MRLDFQNHNLKLTYHSLLSLVLYQARAAADSHVAAIVDEVGRRACFSAAFAVGGGRHCPVFEEKALPEVGNNGCSCRRFTITCWISGLAARNQRDYYHATGKTTQHLLTQEFSGHQCSTYPDAGSGCPLPNTTTVSSRPLKAQHNQDPHTLQTVPKSLPCDRLHQRYCNVAVSCRPCLIKDKGYKAAVC